MAKKNKLFISGIVLLLAGAVILLFLLMLSLVFQGNVADSGDFLLEEIQEAPVTDLEGATISIPGMESMTIEADAETVSVRLYNPENNPCYFEISITLDDGTEIYRSNMISPGQELYEIELNEALEAGEYSAVLQYETYSLDEAHTPMNGASVPITIYAVE